MFVYYRILSCTFIVGCWPFTTKRYIVCKRDDRKRISNEGRYCTGGMHLSIHYTVVLDRCIFQYIRQLYWRDASLNTLGNSIRGMHLPHTQPITLFFLQKSLTKSALSLSKSGLSVRVRYFLHENSDCGPKTVACCCTESISCSVQPCFQKADKRGKQRRVVVVLLYD